LNSTGTELSIIPMMKNAIRTLSGVTPVAVLTKPFPCPGSCIYCPHEENVPVSYLAQEPAVMRAITNRYNPFDQVSYRLNQYIKTGHITQKVELIILGGSWSSYPFEYRKEFVKSCLDALNKKKSESFEEAASINEKAEHRMVGLSIETRPDLITPKEISRMRNLGVTKVELGVQTTDEEILKLIRRGHGVKEVKKATQLLKDAGFKVLYHIMPGLPGASPKKDLEVFDILFQNSAFQPDMLKIYPCVVVSQTELYHWFKEGKYVPYANSELLDLLIKIKGKIPPYVRLMRLFRDIPANYIQGGSKKSNLREIIREELERRGLACQCIRCREIRNQTPEKNLTLKRINYEASQGREIFLEYIDSQDRIYALLRLRIPSYVFKKSESLFKVLGNSSIIREIHVYGVSTPLSNKGKVQHRGLGKKLIEKAQEITQREFGLGKMAVISGIGVREYYRKLGFKLQETYMVKELK